MNDIKGQFLIFLAFVFVGMCVSLLFVLTHFTRRMKILGDIAFGCALIAGAFGANLLWNNGEFRFFVFLGTALGWIVGAKTLAPLLDRALSKLYNLLININGSDADEAKPDFSKQKTDFRGDNLHGDSAGNDLLADNSHGAKRRLSKKG